MKSLTQKIDYANVGGVGNRHKNYAATTTDLTGANHTTVELCDNNTGNVFSAVDSHLSSILTTQPREGAARQPNGKATVIGMRFNAATAAVQLALASAEDWTAGNAEDDYLMFWIRASRTTAADDFDVELRDSSNALITNADFALEAITVAGKWQLVVIDTSTPTLSDVQYIRFIMDGTTSEAPTTLWIDSIVRSDANCLDNAVYKNCDRV